MIHYFLFDEMKDLSKKVEAKFVWQTSHPLQIYLDIWFLFKKQANKL